MSQQLLHALLALPGSSKQKVLVVLAREVPSEEPNSCRAQGAALEQAGDGRVAPNGARGFDPVVDGILGKVKDVHAVLEE